MVPVSSFSEFAALFFALPSADGTYMGGIQPLPPGYWTEYRHLPFPLKKMGHCRVSGGQLARILESILHPGVPSAKRYSIAKTREFHPTVRAKVENENLTSFHLLIVPFSQRELTSYPTERCELWYLSIRSQSHHWQKTEISAAHSLRSWISCL